MSDFRRNIISLKPCCSAPSCRPAQPHPYFPQQLTSSSSVFLLHIVHICMTSNLIISECILLKDGRLRALWATPSATQETLQKVFIQSNLMEPSSQHFSKRICHIFTIGKYNRKEVVIEFQQRQHLWQDHHFAPTSETSAHSKF